MSDIRQLPNTGTQKANRDLINYIVTAAWLISAVCNIYVLGDVNTKETLFKYDLIIEMIATYGVTFQAWWVAVGINYGIYTVGESQRKKADAMMNVAA